MIDPLTTAETLILAGELDAALDILDAHLQSAADDLAARRLRADVLRHLPDRARDALAEFDALAEISALTVEEEIHRYHLRAGLGDPNQALARLEAAWTAHGDLRLAELLLRAFYAQGATARAFALLVDLPKTWRLLEWSGDFYALNGDDRVAAEYYCSAVDQLDEADADPLRAAAKADLLLKRADVYRRMERFADADADYEAANAIMPDDAGIPFQRGLLRFERGELAEAVTLIRAALDSAPESLRASLWAALHAEPRYAPLVAALER